MTGMSDAPVEFAVGDRVTFREGRFSAFDAEVVEVDLAARIIRVEIPVFGGRTPVELAFEEAARILGPATDQPR